MSSSLFYQQQLHKCTADGYRWASNASYVIRLKPKYPILTSGLFIFIQVWGKLSMHIFTFVGLSGQKSLYGGRMRVSLITITTTAYQARSLPLGVLWTPGSEGMELCWVTSTASCRATPPHRWLSRQSVNCELWPYLIIVTWSVCMRAASPTAFRRVMDSASYSAKHVWPLADNQIHVELCVMTEFIILSMQHVQHTVEWHHLANVSNRVPQNCIMQGQDTSEFLRYKCIKGVVLVVCMLLYVDGLTCQEESSILSIRPAVLWASLGHWDHQQLRWDSRWWECAITIGS